MVEAEGRGEIGKSVFDGLTANRRSCVECGYTEAVMHFAFDNWQLAVPRLAVRHLLFLSCTYNSHRYIAKLSVRGLFGRLHPPRAANGLYMS